MNKIPNTVNESQVSFLSLLSIHIKLTILDLVGSLEQIIWLECYILIIIIMYIKDSFYCIRWVDKVERLVIRNQVD